MQKQILGTAALMILVGCGDQIIRTFPLAPSPSLPHGAASLSGTSLIVEMEGAEDLSPEYRWVAWAVSDLGSEALGEVHGHEPLEVDTGTLATAIVDIEEVMITEETEADDLPAAPSKRAWMHGAFPGPLQVLGLGADAFAAATAEVVLDNAHVEVNASGLPTLPTGFSYIVWLEVEPEHEEPGGEAHAEGLRVQTETSTGGHEAEMVSSKLAGVLGGGTFLANELDTLAATAHAARVTLESDNGVETMSSALTLRGDVVLTAQAGSAPAPSEPEAHTH